MRFLQTGVFLLCLTGTIMAGNFQELAGDLPKIVTAQNSPYLVVADIFVPAGKAVRIEPGTVFLFKNFTGLHIQGVLAARGSRSGPIVFTSENDSYYNAQSTLNPTPYDWNGIYIHKDGIGTELENVKIQYSVKGIVSETKFLKIGHAEFRENGRSNVTIEGEEKEVTAEPYSYSLSTKDAAIDGVPIRILRDPEASKRNVWRYTGLGLFVAGAAVGGVFAGELNSSASQLESLSSKNLSNLAYNNSSEWKSARTQRNRDLTGMIAGFTIAAIGAIGFSWSFTF